MHEPQPLVDVLERGDLTSSHVWLAGLADLVMLEFPLLPPLELAHRASIHRSSRESLLQMAVEYPDDERLEKLLTFDTWAADLFSDPELVERFCAALPAPMIEERRRAFDQHRRPHPIAVRMLDRWWQCDSCGATFDQDQAEAVVITAREGYSDLPYEITYCAICISMASEAVRPTGPDGL